MNTRMVARLLLVLVLQGLLTGCWNRVELNDIAIIPTVGIDLMDDGRIRVSVNVVIPAHVSSPSATGGRPQTGRPVETLSETGRDIMDAVRRLQLKVPRQLFWGQLRSLVLGEEFARSGFRQWLDFWTRHRQPRLNAFVVTVPGEAHEFLKVSLLLRRLPTDAIRETLGQQRGTEVLLKDLAGALASGSEDPIIPLFELVSSEQPTDGRYEDIRLAGVALFQEDRLVGRIGPDEMQALVWLRGEGAGGTITATAEEGTTISALIVRSVPERRVSLGKDRFEVSLRVKVEADINESGTALDLGDPAVIARLESVLRQSVERQVKEVFTLAVSQHKVDALRLGTGLYRANPQAWRQVSKNWREYLPKSRLDLQVDVEISRTGRHGAPLHLPREEVEK